jgi:hypothetical protein
MTGEHRPKCRWQFHDLLLAVGVACVVISPIAVFYLWMVYNVMSTFPVPGPDPVPPATGPGIGDYVAFGCLGFVGIGGIIIIVASCVVRRACNRTNRGFPVIPHETTTLTDRPREPIRDS